MDFAAHASSFGPAATRYDRARPRYPRPALRWALDGDTTLDVVTAGQAYHYTPKSPGCCTPAAGVYRATKH
ncbi:hypothetical protein [Dactylosporangium roseum]|uniref:hypothetical protein n=1 Tax=Dactylosporangium roseum TaxID=47989 RepID=UPI0021B3010E|nr:hypothetical protein [Dactylosporangium roseum]